MQTKNQEIQQKCIYSKLYTYSTYIWSVKTTGNVIVLFNGINTTFAWHFASLTFTFKLSDFLVWNGFLQWEDGEPGIFFDNWNSFAVVLTDEMALTDYRNKSVCLVNLIRQTNLYQHLLVLMPVQSISMNKCFPEVRFLRLECTFDEQTYS